MVGCAAQLMEQCAFPFPPLAAVCCAVDLERTLCKSFAFPPPPLQRSWGLFKLLHFPYLKLHVFYRVEGFVLVLLLRLFYLLPKVCVLHFEDLK